jgi:hypothetical protein
MMQTNRKPTANRPEALSLVALPTRARMLAIDRAADRQPRPKAASLLIVDSNKLMSLTLKLISIKI